MNIDALTGLPIIPPPEPAAAIFLDIDGFRRVNCDLGHLVGDELLARLGGWLSQQARLLGAQAFRVAGDEFLLLLPGRTLEQAAAVANQLVVLPEPLASITLSAVVFSAGPDLRDRLRPLLDELAEKLYRAELASGREYSNVVIDG